MDLSEETFERVFQTARALGEGTRFRIFRRLCGAAPEPVSVRDLTESFDLHPNAIRQHLARLEQAGLVTSSPRREGGAGRPRRVYLATPEGLRVGATRGSPGALLAVLEEALQALPADRETLVEFGRAWGRAWARHRRSESGPTRGRRARAELLATELAIWGWEPTTDRHNGTMSVATGRCLFRGASPGSNGRCCALEEGFLSGLAEGLLEGRATVALDGCRLALSV
ncbi:MAG TPA: helix-turn-helix domain-containing protein [Actinomycetota bacterium]